MKKLSMGMIGLCCYVGGAASSLLAPPTTDASARLGQGTATLIFFVAGTVLIIVHFVRKRS